jgi:hypothetical protein
LTAFSHPGTSRVDAVVRAARRRAALVLGAEQLAITLCLLFAGVSLLLIAGTQILDARWLLLLLAAGIITGVLRYRKRQTSAYRVAQLVDARLGLQDALSTAWFFAHEASSTGGSGPAAGPPADVVAEQRRQAEEVAAAVDPAPAIPITGRRTWAATAVLALVACSLFGARYFVERSLDLRASLFPLRWEAVVAAFEQKLPFVNPKPESDPGVDAKSGELQAQTEGEDPRLNDALGIKNPYGQENAGEPGDTKDPDSRRLDPASRTSPLASGEGADSAPPQTAPGEPSPNSPPPGNQPGSQQKNGQQGQQPPPGLMDKMKDAVSSVLAKMRSASQRGADNQQQNNSQDETKSAAAQKEQAESSQKGSQTQQGSQESGAQSDEQSRTGERAQNVQGRNSDKSSDNGNESHSGVGHQDGIKDLKEAEQQRAMGKLAEIIGKRSANLTGEVMVEVPSGKQQLRTQYSQKNGKHADLGGEINRDQVPLVDQSFVREYMEQVHKQAKGVN